MSATSIFFCVKECFLLGRKHLLPGSLILRKIDFRRHTANGGICCYIRCRPYLISRESVLEPWKGDYAGGWEDLCEIRIPELQIMDDGDIDWKRWVINPEEGAVFVRATPRYAFVQGNPAFEFPNGLLWVARADSLGRITSNFGLENQVRPWPPSLLVEEEPPKPMENLLRLTIRAIGAEGIPPDMQITPSGFFEPDSTENTCEYLLHPKNNREFRAALVNSVFELTWAENMDWNNGVLVNSGLYQYLGYLRMKRSFPWAGISFREYLRDETYPGLFWNLDGDSSENDQNTSPSQDRRRRSRKRSLDEPNDFYSLKRREQYLFLLEKNFTVADIASTLGVAVGSVKKTIYRYRKQGIAPK
ncbi:sigma-70 region 4 domain-containing protein [bacterium]|nr:sigma-70 region 4 domain-containing protein [bacterium]